MFYWTVLRIKQYNEIAGVKYASKVSDLLQNKSAVDDEIERT